MSLAASWRASRRARQLSIKCFTKVCRLIRYEVIFWVFRRYHDGPIPLSLPRSTLATDRRRRLASVWPVAAVEHGQLGRVHAADDALCRLAAPRAVRRDVAEGGML